MQIKEKKHITFIIFSLTFLRINKTSLTKLIQLMKDQFIFHLNILFQNKQRRNFY